MFPKFYVFYVICAFTSYQIYLFFKYNINNKRNKIEDYVHKQQMFQIGDEGIKTYIIDCSSIKKYVFIDGEKNIIYF